MNRRAFVRRGVTAGAALAAASGAGWTMDAFAAQGEATPAVEFTPGTIETLLGTVELPENPTRVVCVTDGPVDTMLNLGLTPLATAFSYGSSGAVMEYLQPYTDVEIEYLGGWESFDMERLIELAPDLILGEGGGRFTDVTREGAEADPAVQAMLKVAPLVIPMDIDTSDPLGLQTFEYGHLVWSHCLGKLEEGQAILDAQRQKTAALLADLSSHEGETSIVVRPNADFPLVMSQEWFTGVLLRRVGIVGNEFAEDLPYPHSADSLSLEQMDQLDADWIFLAPRFAATESAEREGLLATYFDNPLFGGLPAIANGQYGIVDGQVWSGANSMIAADIVLDNIRGVIVDGVQNQMDAE